MGIGGIEERRMQYTHRRKTPGGWDYWRADKPNQFVREVWIGIAGRSIETHELED